MLLPPWMGGSIAFLYGIVVGSFLNVCIYRLPEDESIVHPPSHCPKCGAKLKAVDLVPLLSFLFLGRKCRYCGAPISWRYFTIELITGLMFVACYLTFGYTIDFFPYVLFLSALIVAFVVDLEHFIIPDQVPIAGVIIGIGRDIAHIIAGDGGVTRISVPFTNVHFPMLSSVVGIVVCGGLFYLIAWSSFYVFRPKDEEGQEDYEGAMGGGDVKLAAAMGAVLGALPALASFLIAVLLGTVFGVALIVAKSLSEKRGVPWRTAIPFGPYMVAGAAAVIFFTPQLHALWAAWVRLITLG
jgi:leader peptidase (prepilin peptidase) / N-methyltransferase